MDGCRCNGRIIMCYCLRHPDSTSFATGPQENKNCVPASAWMSGGHCYVDQYNDCVPDHRFDILGTSIACESGWEEVVAAACEDGYEWCEVLEDAEEFLLYYHTRWCDATYDNEGNIIDCSCVDWPGDTKTETVDNCYYG